MAKQKAPRFRARKGSPGTTYTYNDNLVGQVELKADGTGIVRIGSAAEARAADGLHLRRAVGVSSTPKAKAVAITPTESPEA